jgi:hypothetical protein
MKRSKKMTKIPMCVDCPKARIIRALPATRTDPPEPGGFECLVRGEFIPEGQEPVGECEILEAYEKGYEDAIKTRGLRAMEPVRGHRRLERCEHGFYKSLCKICLSEAQGEL